MLDCQFFVDNLLIGHRIIDKKRGVNYHGITLTRSTIRDCGPETGSIAEGLWGVKRAAVAQVRQGLGHVS
jgi:hypothetical protein